MERLDLRRVLARAEVLSELPFSRLGDSAMVQLLRHLVGQCLVPPALASTFQEAMGGVPLYLIERVRRLIEKGRLDGGIPTRWFSRCSRASG